MYVMFLAWLGACDDGKDDTAGGGTPVDDSATPVDDSGTEKPDDSGTGPDDSGDDSGDCDKIEWFQDLDMDGYGAGAATLACKSPGADWDRDER